VVAVRVEAAGAWPKGRGAWLCGRGVSFGHRPGLTPVVSFVVEVGDHFEPPTARIVRVHRGTLAQASVAVRRPWCAAWRTARSRRVTVDHHATVNATRFRNPPGKWKGSSGLLGATFASVLIFVVTVGSIALGALASVGDTEPGLVRTWVVGWSIAGIVGVSLVGYIAWAIAPSAHDSPFALGVDLVAVAAAITASALTFVYLSRPLNQGEPHSHDLLLLLVLGLFFAGPLAAWLAALVTRSSGRGVVIVSTFTAIATLATILSIAFHSVG
jgi:hypothetical protein